MQAEGPDGEAKAGGINCGRHSEGGGGPRELMETDRHVRPPEDSGLHYPYTRDPLQVSGPYIRQNRRPMFRERMEMWGHV